MSVKLILIRHGETKWNYTRRYCGHRDISLSPRGRRQALKLRRRMKDEIIHKVYASDRKRAIQTAEIIFNGTRKIERIRGLREINFGDFEGLTHRELLKKHNGIYQKWLKDPYRNHAPNGEKLNEFKKRVNAAFKKIISLNRDKTAAIICHGGVISIFITGILKKTKFWKNIPHSASITIIEYKNGKPKIILLDDVSHL